VSGYFHDGLIFSVISWKFILAVVLLILGVLIIGYGVNKGKLRFRRRPDDKTTPARTNGDGA
jgi:hypothetical protein